MKGTNINRVWTAAGPIGVADQQATQRVIEVETSTAASVADAIPLGLTAFGLTALFFGCVYTFFASPLQHTIDLVPLALVLGGGLQLLASMWAMRKGSTYPATLFGITSAFWVTWGVMEAMAAQGTIAATATLSVENGVFFMLWGIVMLSLGLAGLRYSSAVAGAVSLLGLSWLCLCIGSWAGVAGWAVVGGILAMISGIVGLYAGFAYIYDTVNHSEVLPVGRLDGLGLEGGAPLTTAGLAR